MKQLLEKLMKEKFEDTFKPIDRTELAKRNKEYLAELKTYNSEILEMFFEDLINLDELGQLIAEAYANDKLDLWIEAIQSGEFKKNATKRLLEYFDNMVEGMKEHIEYRQEEESDETQNM
jgi:23S rRNA G2069 N7-methylase RlmK/C1962 C5-methylase RlmI